MSIVFNYSCPFQAENIHISIRHCPFVCGCVRAFFCVCVPVSFCVCVYLCHFVCPYFCVCVPVPFTVCPCHFLCSRLCLFCVGACAILYVPLSILYSCNRNKLMQSPSWDIKGESFDRHGLGTRWGFMMKREQSLPKRHFHRSSSTKWFIQRFHKKLSLFFPKQHKLFFSLSLHPSLTPEDLQMWH